MKKNANFIFFKIPKKRTKKKNIIASGNFFFFFFWFVFFLKKKIKMAKVGQKLGLYHPFQNMPPFHIKTCNNLFTHG
jgi:hypothetical protein